MAFSKVPTKLKYIPTYCISTVIEYFLKFVYSYLIGHVFLKLNKFFQEYGSFLNIRHNTHHNYQLRLEPLPITILIMSFLI